MKGLHVFGEYAFEFIVITLLLALSAVLVIPFVPMTVGVVGYFRQNIHSRRFKDIFTTIGANWKILIFYTIFQLILIIFPVLNIYFFSTHPESMNFLTYFVLAVSCVALLVGVIYLITAPVIIVNMKVNVRQLIYNGIMLLFGGLWRSLLSLACVGGIIALVMLYPYPVPLTLYAAPYLISVLMTENFYRLKAKSLGVSVYELKKQLKEDDYLDENGKINRSEKENPEENNEEN
ncbi:MAG: hypothetical protein K2N22_05380 [Clostridia bacterium]|nr:hypothetical protein [Clostridia bacterium]